MRFSLIILTAALLGGCGDQEKPRQYTEVVRQAPAAAVQPAMSQKGPDNPHASLNMGAVTPEARTALQKMLAEGQDPHAGIDMSAFSGSNPHAGLDMQGTGQPSAAPSPYTWALPQGWKQGPNKGGMRLASFYLDGNPDAIDCYVVSLPGMAGGLEANLQRWMGQVGIEPGAANTQQLLKSPSDVQTRGGLAAKVYDLTSLQTGTAPKSMIAAIISDNGATVFVKMTGTAQDVKANRDGFLEFLKSLAAK